MALKRVPTTQHFSPACSSESFLSTVSLPVGRGGQRPREQRGAPARGDGEGWEGSCFSSRHGAQQTCVGQMGPRSIPEPASLQAFPLSWGESWVTMLSLAPSDSSARDGTFLPLGTGAAAPALHPGVTQTPHSGLAGTPKPGLCQGQILCPRSLLEFRIPITSRKGPGMLTGPWTLGKDPQGIQAGRTSVPSASTLWLRSKNLPHKVSPKLLIPALGSQRCSSPSQCVMSHAVCGCGTVIPRSNQLGKSTLSLRPCLERSKEPAHGLLSQKNTACASSSFLGAISPPKNLPLLITCC